MKKIVLIVLVMSFSFFYGQQLTPYIVVDQFGYRPDSEKIAVMRNPVTGFDAAASFTPGLSYAIIDKTTGLQVYTGSAVPYNGGAEDASSGDSAWWFDFSTLATPGTYYVLDINQNLRSFEFVINDNVYEEVLKHAVRTFFYQRAGYAKEAQYAGAAWADGASHLGTLQDTQCRKYDTPSDASSQKDLSGGWYDAGDYSKYTTWAANYIVDLLKAYKENPNAWSDDYNLPYSGNGIPDLVDEIKWGLDYLIKLQETNGSMISVVDLAEASPPSTATEQSLYGEVNTSCTLAAAGAFAYGAKVFNELGMTGYSNTLLQSATNAWNWADANPNVIWQNNIEATNSVGIGSGRQEVDDYGRFAYKMRAAIHLFDVTNSASYKTFVENNYEDIHLMLWNFAFPFEQTNQEALLFYASLDNASTAVATAINSTYLNAMNSVNNFDAFNNESDPYLAHLVDYVWGSNSSKSRKGLMFTDYVTYSINSGNSDNALRAAERYLHYLHGVNPLNFCYLSNMYEYGADQGVNEFYHAWFGDGTPWDNVQNDLYGPAPGYLTGGPNPEYTWEEECCPSNCSGQACDAARVSRINGQPSQKAYDDFNTSWPMNSWEVTENSNGYQAAYIRLLSRFVDLDGTLSVDAPEKETLEVQLFPNPFHTSFTIRLHEDFRYELYNIVGELVHHGTCSNACTTGKTMTNTGVYFVKIITDTSSRTFKVVKK